MAGPDHVFIGFLLNPIDGATYLAKMRIGWSGEWRFTLPYTAKTSLGAYLFLYYIFLGHLARWLGLSLLAVFHLARLVNSFILLVTMYVFYNRVFPSRQDLAGRAFLLAAIGSGMGWLIVLGGTIPFDFWVPEAYPFLSMYSNPHFPAALSLLLLSIIFLLDHQSPQRSMKLLITGLAMAVIYPFGEVLIVLFAVGWVSWNWLSTRHIDWSGLVCPSLPGGAFLLYQYFATQYDPLLKAWNDQNVTLTPSVGEVLLSLSPALVLAILGAWFIFRQKENAARVFLLMWPIWGFLLAYLPMSLQRRFTSGIFIPLAALAIYGIEFISIKAPRWGPKVMIIVFVLSLPTNVFIISSAMLAAPGHPPLLYLTRDEDRALSWIQANLPEGAVILASPELSLMIPTRTACRVVYAHPFETVNASVLEKEVNDFFQQPGWSEEKTAFLQENSVRYILLGPRERLSGAKLDTSRLRLVSQSGDVFIYSVDGAQ